MSKLMDFLPFAMKNLLSKPATSNYPAEPIAYPERSRGHIEVDIEKCVLCGSCQRKCPSSAITVDRKEGYWAIERMGCIQCGYCVDNCPKNCLEIVPGYTAPSGSKTVDKVVKPVEESAAGGATGGKLVNDTEKCVFCTLCAKKCPAGAITVDRAGKTWEVNYDECLECGACVDACPKKSLSFSGEAEAEPEATPVAEEAEVTVEPVVILKPEEQSGPITNDYDKCIFCTLCAKTCPAGALTVDRKAKTWTFDPEYCVICGQCVEVCAKKSLAHGENYLTGDIKITTNVPKTVSKKKSAPVVEKVEKLPVSEQKGPVVNDYDKCVYCSLCAKTCPAEAIEVDRKGKNWKFNDEKCVECGQCVYACPKSSLALK